MYNSLQVKIIKNDKSLDDSDYEYLFDDELQILSETGVILFNLKGYEFKSYECVDNYLIVDIDEGHKFTLNNLYINLDSFTIYEEMFKKGKNYYRRCYDKEKKMIEFQGERYDIKYYFENQDKIIDDYEFNEHQFDTTKDTLLMSIFNLFDKKVDSNSQIKIDGFTFGMSCRDIGKFKNIPRDYNKTIEKQLNDVLFAHINPEIHRIYDIDLTIHYKDNNVDKNFRIKLECKDKIAIKTELGDCYYGYFDENAKLKLD
jgi:hypothetical protein